MAAACEINARTLMLKHTALVDDEQCWQAGTVPDNLGGWTSGCQE